MGSKLNPMKLVQVMIAASHTLPDTSSAIHLLEGVAFCLEQTVLRKKNKAVTLLRMKIAEMLLYMGKLSDCERMVNDGKNDLMKNSNNNEPAILAAVYCSAAQMHKAKKEFSFFLRDVIMYISYLDINAIEKKRKVTTAVDIA